MHTSVPQHGKSPNQQSEKGEANARPQQTSRKADATRPLLGSIQKQTVAGRLHVPIVHCHGQPTASPPWKAQARLQLARSHPWLANIFPKKQDIDPFKLWTMGGTNCILSAFCTAPSHNL